MKQAHQLKLSGWKSSQQKKIATWVAKFSADTVVDLEDFLFAEFSAKCQEVLRIPRSFFSFPERPQRYRIALAAVFFLNEIWCFFIIISVFNMWENRTRTRLKQTEKSIANLRLLGKNFWFFLLCPWTQSDLLFKVTVHNLRLVFL